MIQKNMGISSKTIYEKKISKSFEEISKYICIIFQPLKKAH